MQGQYKVPGGKLVVVDFELQDNCLRSVRVHGDFFLEPESALETINMALEGLSASCSPSAICAAINAKLPAKTVMYGFDCTAIAVALQRGLTPENRS